MKYKYFLIFLLLYSCTPVSSSNYEKSTYNAKGFAYIYSLKDFENKIIKKRSILMNLLFLIIGLEEELY